MIHIAALSMLGAATLGLALGYLAASANHHRPIIRIWAAGLGALVMVVTTITASTAALALVAAIVYLH